MIWVDLKIIFFQDNSEIIETLLSQKVNLNLKDSHGETPVFYAVKKGNLELAQVMVSIIIL